MAAAAVPGVVVERAELLPLAATVVHPPQLEPLERSPLAAAAVEHQHPALALRAV
tara:strand:- start:168 stop:332 length:165 start_codon:yes stop_codon:yes gene_type:complete